MTKKTKMIKFSLKMIMAKKSCWNRIEKRLIGPQFDWRLKNILRTFASSSTVPWKTLLDEKMEFFEIVWNNLFHNWNFRNRLWSYQLGARPSLHGPSNGAIFRLTLSILYLYPILNVKWAPDMSTLIYCRLLYDLNKIMRCI